MDGIPPFRKGYFAPKDGEIIEIYYNPKELEETRTVNYTKLYPIGYSHPVYHYTNGGGNEYNFTLLIKDKLYFGLGFTPIDVEKYISRIIDLTLPVKLGGEMAAGPAVITFVLGDFVKDMIINKVQINRELWNRYMQLKYAHLKFSCEEYVEVCQSRLNYIGL